MLTKLQTTLSQRATGRNILIFLAAFLLFNALIMPTAGKLMQVMSGDSTQVSPLDLQFSYTPEFAFQMIEAYGSARTFYVVVDLTADVLYPLIYATFFGLLITYLYVHSFSARDGLKNLALIPFAMMLADYLENLGIITLLLTYPTQLTVVAQITSLFTSLKWIMFGITLLITLIGLVGWIRQKFQSK